MCLPPALPMMPKPATFANITATLKGGLTLAELLQLRLLFCAPFKPCSERCKWLTPYLARVVLICRVFLPGHKLSCTTHRPIDCMAMLIKSLVTLSSTPEKTETYRSSDASRLHLRRQLRT